MKYIKNIDKSKNDIVKIDMIHGKANTVGSICKIINVSCSSLLTVFFLNYCNFNFDFAL